MQKRWKTLFVMMLLMASSGGVVSALAGNSSATKVNATTQQGSVCKGVVVDATGEPIIGASVVVKGSSKGAVTNVNGEFSLDNVSKGATLVISYVGFSNYEVTYQGKTLNITLREDNQSLDEVVVVGYGTQKKANLTGSVSSINAETLATRPVSSVSSAMAGTMPGVTAIQNSGSPGSQAASITIRGKNSINAANPLVIVDGVPGSMNNIDTQDIESVSVLKDAASAAIYGVQAANGVILITTKKGKKGEKARVNYSGVVSWVSPTAKLDFLGSADYATLYNEATLNENPKAVVPYSDEDIQKFRDHSDPYGHPDTNWYDEVFKSSAVETQHSLAVSGGSESTTYMASVAYLYQDGLSQARNYTRYNARVNLESKVAKWLTLGINGSGYRGIRNDEYEGFESLLQYSNRIPPVYSVRTQDGEYAYNGLQNPVAQQGKTGMNKTQYDQIQTNVYAIVSPFDGFTLKGVYSFRHDENNYSTFKKHYAYANFDSGERQGDHNYYNYNWYTSQLIANYNKTFGNHTIGAMAGYEQQEYKYHYTTTFRKGGGSDELEESLNTLNASTQTNSDGGYETARRSYFGRLQYDYMNRYLFEADFRADASSIFPEDNRWGYFPAFSAAWRVTEEPFMEGTKDWLSNLKLRLGWGKTGNEELSAGDVYPSVATYSYGKVILGDAIYSTAYESRYVNNNLKWATVTNYELGIDAGFLNNKIGFELSLYKKKTNDMLLYLPIMQVIGMDAPAQNAGSVENKGFDLLVYHNNRINKDWSYTASLNLSYVHNEITDMDGTEGPDPKDNKFWRLEGHPIGSFYGFVANGYFNDQNDLDNYPKRTGTEKLGDIKYKDLDGDGKITASGDRQVIGKNFPSWTGGVNLGLTWKDLDLTMLWQAAWDVDAYYTGEASYAFFNSGKVLKRHLDRWTPEHHNASYPRLTRSSQINFQVSSFWLQDASYLRLKNITLGYNLPKKWINPIGLSLVKVFLTGENLITFSHLDGLDPESPSDTRGAFYSNVKKISLGLKVSF